MRYEFEAEPLELDMEIEGESEYGEFEYGGGNGSGEFEFESDGEYDQEAGANVKRVINLPKVVDRETYDEFELGDEVSEEISPTTDSRMPVKDTTMAPFRYICDVAIKMKTTDGKKRAIGHGSGTLIGNKYVLTVGHNIKVDDGHGNVFQAESISVTPGRNTSAPTLKWKPFGSVDAQSWAAHPSWISKFDSQFDFGLITLKKEIGKEKFRALGNKPLGFWGAPGSQSQMKVVDPKTLKDLIVNVGGYPGDRCGDKPTSGSCPANKEGGTQYCAHDKILDPSPASEPRLIWHNADSKAGQSGSPLWRFDRKTRQRNLIGVHTGGVVEAVSRAYVRNTGVRVTADVLKMLTTWGWRA